MNNILVFFGGKSAEHDISIITGVMTLNSIDACLYSPIPVYIDKKGKWFTGEQLFDVSNFKSLDFKKLKQVTLVAGDNSLYAISNKRLKAIAPIKCAINCLHGINGEDGAISGLLKLSMIPLASPGMFCSSFSIDKDFTKYVLAGMGVDKLPHVRIFSSAFYYKPETAIKMVERKFNYPVIVKPACLGSSIGISVANDIKELNSALIEGFKYDEKIIVEKKLNDFIEVNCAAYKKGDKIVVSNCEQPITKHDILSFSDKYLNSKTGITNKKNIKISSEIQNRVQNITEKIYRKADFKGIIRIDFLVTPDKVYVNEINTVPGSLAYYLFVDSLGGFSKILTDVITEGISRYNTYNSRIFDFGSAVLDDLHAKGGKVKPFDNKNLK